MSCFIKQLALPKEVGFKEKEDVFKEKTEFAQEVSSDHR